MWYKWTISSSPYCVFRLKAVERVLSYSTQYKRGCTCASRRTNTMIAVEVKFGGQALLFSPVTAGNPKHREYHRSSKTMTAILREFKAGEKIKCVNVNVICLPAEHQWVPKNSFRNANDNIKPARGATSAKSCHTQKNATARECKVVLN